MKRIILCLRPVLVSACAIILFAHRATADPPATIQALRVIKCVACEADRPAVVTGVAMTPDGRTVAAAMDDHRVLAWDATTGELKGRFEGHTDWVHSVVFSTDGVTLASGAGDRCLCLWDMANGEQRLTLSGCENSISAVSLHPNNQQLAVVGFNQKLRIINSSSGQTSQELVCPCSDVRCVTFSPDGRRMAVAGRRGCIRIWNVTSGAHERDIETDRRRIRAMAFSPDGYWLAVAGASPAIRILDTNTGQLVMVLATRPAKVYSLTFLDRYRLATGGTDNRIWIWDLNSRQSVTHLVGHTGTVAALACDSSGTMLVSGSYDTTLRIWNLAATPAPTTASRAASNETQ